MLAGIVILTGLALGLSALLVLTARLLPADEQSVAREIEQLLPRIQCAQCGYPGCAPYAQAIAAGEAEINRCPPGGEYTIRRIAELLGRDVVPLDRTVGAASMDRVALIDEDACIGCNLCARACPVDAIVGVSQAMHTVIRGHCTGCELCLPRCPVDCIAMVARHA
jgi:electron transport complex protein RnfB